MDLGDSHRLAVVARTLDRMTSNLPSDLFFWAGMGAAAASLGLLFSGKRQASATLAAWIPTMLAFGIYTRIVKATEQPGGYPPSLH
jgi:hypothetical protein